MNPKVDFFFNKTSKWQTAYNKLRILILDCGLVEDLKWGVPCYSLPTNQEGKKSSNIVLIHGFKEYCAILFHKGVLLDDPKGILIQQTENVQSARQIRFTSAEQIIEMEIILKDYLKRAIAIEKSGKKVELKKTKEFNMPEEFEQKLNTFPELKTAFEALTPGRQRGYLLHFSQPKQSKTRVSRIEKSIDPIFNGKGLNDV